MNADSGGDAASHARLRRPAQVIAIRSPSPTMPRRPPRVAFEECWYGLRLAPPSGRSLARADMRGGELPGLGAGQFRGCLGGDVFRGLARSYPRSGARRLRRLAVERREPHARAELERVDPVAAPLPMPGAPV